jgi:small subunit ribosomal protein S13
MSILLNLKFKDNLNTYVILYKCYGISTKNILCLLCKLGINGFLKYKELTSFIKGQLNFQLDLLIEKHFKIRIDRILKHDIEVFLNRLTELRNLRALRHKQFLPVRGQRTHSNAKTQKNKLKNRLHVLKLKMKTNKQTNK